MTRKMYFTFGSDPGFPYGRDDYVLVEADSYRACLDKYKERHPNRTPGLINCAEYYTESSWKSVAEAWYKGRQPAEVIR